MENNQSISTTGIVHGKTIILAADPGLADGDQVRVVLFSQSEYEPGIDGLLRSAGALADDWTDEDDRILQEIYESRKKPGRPLPQ